MHTPNKIFAQDSQERIRLRLNQNLTGHTVAIRTRNMDTGTEVTAAAEIVAPASDGLVERDWQANERPIAGGIFYVEAVDTDGSSKTRTFPGATEKAIIVQVMPRRTQVGA